MSQEELQILRELDCPEEPRIKKKTPRTAMRDVEEDDQEQ